MRGAVFYINLYYFMSNKMIIGTIFSSISILEIWYRHEKRCEPANLVRGQFLQKIGTFWIRTINHKDVDKRYSQIDQNLEKDPTRSQETSIWPQNPNT